MSLAITVGYPRLGAYYDYEPVSDSSELLTRKWAQEKNYMRGSASDWFPTIDAVLQGIRKECLSADWDGPGAVPITDQVIAIARRVVESLFILVPKGTPAPDLVPEADGEICIRWFVETDRQLSLSVGGHGNINFAGQFGQEGGIHGWQPFNGAPQNTLHEPLEDIAKYLGKLYPPIIGGRAA